MPIEKRWLTAAETGEYLHLHPKSVYRACLARKLPHTKIPGVGVRVDKRELDALLERESVNLVEYGSASRTSMDEGRYLCSEGAAKYTGLSKSYLQKLTSRRRVPFLKVGRRALYDRVLLDKWLSRRAVLPRDWGRP